jgi:hypothetical protein
VNPTFLVCEVVDASLRASFDDLELPSDEVQYEIADLTLADGRTFIHVVIGVGSLGFVDLATGETVGDLPNVPAVIKRWEIVRVVDGKATGPIFEWPRPTKGGLRHN